MAAKNDVVVMQNIIDISDDNLVYDKQYDSPLSLMKRVATKIAAPNVTRYQKQWVGVFLKHYFKDGKIDGKPNMYDPRLAAKAAAPGDSLGKMKLFVAVVYIPELHKGITQPAKDDEEAIGNLAKNGGLFLCEKYLLNGGTIPTYGDNVWVTYANLINRTGGRFLLPEVEGAGAKSGGFLAGAIPGFPPGVSPFRCGPSRIKTPKPKKSKNTKTTKKSAKAPAKKEKKKVTSKPKKPSKKEVNKQTPAKKAKAKRVPCPAPQGKMPVYKKGAKKMGDIIKCPRGNCELYRQKAGVDPVGNNGPGDFSAAAMKGTKYNRLQTMKSGGKGGTGWTLSMGPGKGICRNPIILRHGRRRGKCALGKPKFIVLHTGSQSGTINHTLCVLQKGNLSTNYEVARDGTIYEYYHSKYATTHCAGGYNNCGIGIDMNQKNGKPNAAQEIGLSKLIRVLCKRHNIPPVAASLSGPRHKFGSPNQVIASGVGIIGHMNVSSNRGDPGKTFPMKRIMGRVSGGKMWDGVPRPPKPEAKELAKGKDKDTKKKKKG